MVSIAVVVMKRSGGLLLGLPVGFIPLEDLQAASDQESGSVLGPRNTFTVPAIRDPFGRSGRGGARDRCFRGYRSSPCQIHHNRRCLVLLCRRPSPCTISTHFAPISQGLARSSVFFKGGILLRGQRAGARCGGGTRDTSRIRPAPSRRKRTKGPKASSSQGWKKVTTASLSEQLGSVTQLLPTIANRLIGFDSEGAGQDQRATSHFRSRRRSSLLLEVQHWLLAVLEH